jgi:hypothetical protein
MLLLLYLKAQRGTPLLAKLKPHLTSVLIQVIFPNDTLVFEKVDEDQMKVHLFRYHTLPTPLMMSSIQASMQLVARRHRITFSILNYDAYRSWRMLQNRL